MDLRKILDTAPEPAIVDAQTMGVSGDTSGDYWLPAPMCLYQKELSEQIVSLHYSDILKYFETKDFNQDVVLHSMQTMCLNSEFVATHPYLLIDHFVPKSLITKDIPGHLAETSGKFSVLRDLIALVQDYDTDTAIFCRPGRTMDLLEALLLGNRVNIKRYDGQSIKTKQKPKKFSCTCHLFPSAEKDLVNKGLDAKGHFDMLLCLDPTVDTNAEHVQHVLKYHRPRRGQGSTAPIVRLTTINSIDHCELFFGKKATRASKEYLTSVTAAVVVLRDVVGTLPPDLRPIYSQNLRYLIEWLEDPNISWPLPDVYPIKTYTPMDVERSLLTEVRYNQTDDNLQVGFQSGKKRGRKPNSAGLKGEDLISYYMSKRLKNDYSTNPLKQKMGQLTGIAIKNDSGSVNYHLSGGLLTHRLIQLITGAYDDLEGQSSELEHFQDMESIQLNHLETLTKDYNDIRRQLEEATNSIQTNERESREFLSSSEKEHENIEIITKEIESLLKTLKSRDSDSALLAEVLIETIDVQEEIEREKRLTISRETEYKYMEEEIIRADSSISTTAKQKEDMVKEIELLQRQVESGLKEGIINSQNTDERIKSITILLDEEKESVKKLEQQLSDVTDQLAKINPTGTRSANFGNRGKQRGHYNN